MLFLIVGISFVLPLYSGGDHFGLHRFMVPFLPVIILAGIQILHRLNFFVDNTKLVLLFLVIFFTNEYNLRNWYFYRQYPITGEWLIAQNGRATSKKLNDFFSSLHKLPSQGVIGAGGSAYAYDGVTIDLLGINNTKMAQAKKNENLKHIKKTRCIPSRCIFSITT